MTSSRVWVVAFAAAIVLLAVGAFSSVARAHCDTTQGPVVADARRALESAAVTPVLKWVEPSAEPEVRAAFDHVLRVRELGPEARELADTFFFETLVRLHRMGEGAPYTGLKDDAPEAVILAVDEALLTGEVDALANELSGAVSSGVHDRYRRAREARRHVEESVEHGREYVQAYVELTHYVERIHQAAVSPAGHPTSSTSDGTPAKHGHH